MTARIEDYALISDCHTAALVGRNGSIDWLCVPRFDSGACFASLLGSADNGHWAIAPIEKPQSIRRRYLEDTLVLETEFQTSTGTIALIDFMPPRDLAPDVIRIVEGRRGRVAMRTELVIRFDYGSIIPWVTSADDGLLRAIAGPDMLRLKTPIPLLGEDHRTRGEFDVGEGERVPFNLTWHSSYHPEPSCLDPFQALDGTLSWWREWAGRCTYQGRWREAVIRSLMVLKGLTYAPTGGIVAAPTTSLPEKIGGTRNWDYRYCWIRDATFTLLALMASGYREEAAAWREWLLRAAAGAPEKLQVMYGLAGERRLTELELGWLAGYESSRPVRIGNGASEQRQLDVYGELADALFQARKYGLEQAPAGWVFEKVLLDFLEGNWRQADQGIWETRGRSRSFTHSKIMSWVAFDRAVRTNELYGLDGPVERWRSIRREIHAEVCRHGFDPRRNSFVQSYGSDRLDAALLLIPQVGFLSPMDPRVIGTVEAVERDLTSPDGLVLRYPTEDLIDGLPPGEGRFLVCSFWLSDALAMIGRMDDAQKRFERLLALGNDVGLLSEEYDPSSGRLAGNFPQALSHIGLINTALNLTSPASPATQRQND